jgi:hypothetical protein
MLELYRKLLRKSVLDATLGDPPGDEATDMARNVFETRHDDYIVVQCALFAAM